MGWVRVSDDFYDHPKFVDLTPLSIALWLTSVAYCNRNRTDGQIAASAASRLCDFDGLAYKTSESDLFVSMEDDVAPLAIDDLVKNDLWHTNGHDCPECPQPGRRYYYIHDYLKYQPSADEIRERAAARSRAGKKGAASKWHGMKDGESHD